MSHEPRFRNRDQKNTAMKITQILLLSAFFLSTAVNAVAQENRGVEETGHIKWRREVYRYLDLTKERNAALYHPTEPGQGGRNLFTLIFKLLAEEKIVAYEYLDGKELFTDEYKIDFKELLDRFGIGHELTNGKPVVDEEDIPSHEIQGYYLKELYSFDTGTSNYRVRPIAISPILFRQGEYEPQTVRYPLFWVPYDQLRPYLLRTPVMSSSLNNALSGTIDDFFIMREYDGEIYKSSNPRNLAISQYTSTPEELKAEQERIEKELNNFERMLWQGGSDSTRMVPQRKKRGGTTTMRNRRY